MPVECFFIDQAESQISIFPLVEKLLPTQRGQVMKTEIY